MAIGPGAKARALRDGREKSLNYDNGGDIMRSNEAIKGRQRQWWWCRWWRSSVDGIDGRCWCATPRGGNREWKGVKARVTQAGSRISVTGHRAEPNEQPGDLCAGDDTVRVPGIIAVRGQQLL